MTAPLILRTDARHLPLADASVDLIVTSPPYWALRDYTDGGGHLTGQVGAEETPLQYLDHLIEATREMVRVLKLSGSLWINLGDKYSDRSGGRHSGSGTGRGPQQGALPQTRGPREKSLLGVPWRYAIRCMDELGLTLRAEVIWSKPNGLPESVTDRVRRSHEQWFHLTRGPQYFADVDPIREPHEMRPQRRPSGRTEDLTPRQGHPRQTWSTSVRDEPGVDGHPLGRMPGSVWSIPTQPLSAPAELGIDHYAAFPMELPRRIIQGWSPAGICVVCSQPLRSVSELTGEHGRTPGGGRTYGAIRLPGAKDTNLARAALRVRRIVGYTCGCPEPGRIRPSVVLDPFGGTGTAALVASALGRLGVSCDLSGDYCRLAGWRCSDPGEVARALQVQEVTQPVGMDSLFELDGAAS